MGVCRLHHSRYRNRAHISVEGFLKRFLESSSKQSSKTMDFHEFQIFQHKLTLYNSVEHNTILYRKLCTKIIILIYRFRRAVVARRTVSNRHAHPRAISEVHNAVNGAFGSPVRSSGFNYKFNQLYRIVQN